MNKTIVSLLAMGFVVAGCQTQDLNNNINAMNINNSVPQASAAPEQAAIPAPEFSKAVMNTSMGKITVEFYVKDAPATVNNFIKLAKEGFYDNTRFHRVISNFMIQGGDPLSKDDSKKQLWGTGGPGYEFEDEFNSNLLASGSLAMANSGPDTNGSQFFIVTAESTPWLDGKHTNFGFVVEGKDIVEKIGEVKTDASDRPVQDVILQSIDLIK